jgi:hypothetical protein
MTEGSAPEIRETIASMLQAKRERAAGMSRAFPPIRIG